MSFKLIHNLVTDTSKLLRHIIFKARNNSEPIQYAETSLLKHFYAQFRLLSIVTGGELGQPKSAHNLLLGKVI